MKTTELRPVFMGPVDLKDPDAIRAAIHELEGHFNALYDGPFTRDTLVNLASEWGYTWEQGRRAYHFLGLAVEKHWKDTHPEHSALNKDDMFSVFHTDRRARKLDSEGYYFSELTMSAVFAVLDNNARAHRIRTLLLRFLAAYGITDTSDR